MYQGFGDSGSWVVSEDQDDTVLGHIVAGDSQSTIAYAAPLEAVLADIEITLFCKVTLAKKETCYARKVGKENQEEFLSSRPGSVATPLAQSNASGKHTPKIRDDACSSPQDARLPRPLASPVIPSFVEGIMPNKLPKFKATESSTELQKPGDGFLLLKSTETGHEYFIDGYGINDEVIAANVDKELGASTLVQHGKHIVSSKNCD